MRGGAASSQKGSRYERDLVNTLRDLEFGVLRCGGSGSGSDEDLPDVLASRPYVVADDWVEVGTAGMHEPVAKVLADAWAIELKVGDGTTLYVGPEEVEALENFAGRFGAEPLLGARYTTRDSPLAYFLVRPEDARMTDSGNYGLPVDDIAERAAYSIHPGEEPAVEEADHA